jgi:hypothetical protein
VRLLKLDGVADGPEAGGQKVLGAHVRFGFTFGSRADGRARRMREVSNLDPAAFEDGFPSAFGAIELPLRQFLVRLARVPSPRTATSTGGSLKVGIDVGKARYRERWDVSYVETPSESFQNSLRAA